MSNTNSASESIHVEVNGKDLMAENIKNDRYIYVNNISTERMNELLAVKNTHREAQKSLQRDAEELAELFDKDGNPCSLAKKKAEIDKREDGIYGIPIIGSIVKLIMQAYYENKVKKAKQTLVEKDPIYSQIFTTAEKERIKQEAVAANKAANELAKNNIETIKSGTNNEQKQQFAQDLKDATKQIDYEKFVNNRNKEANKKQEQVQAKVNTNALTQARSSQIQNIDPNVQVDSGARAQMQDVEPAYKMPAGLQIGSVSNTAGSNRSSGAQSRGTGQGQGQSAGVQF